MTWRSSIASSKAACVLGLARLISSPRTMFEKTGPRRNTNFPRSRSHTETPVRSEGSRSGVNWIRWKLQSIERARDFASRVLPTPGTSSTSACPPAISVCTTRLISSCLPWMTRSMLATIDTNRSVNHAASVGLGSAVKESSLAKWNSISLSRPGVN